MSKKILFYVFLFLIFGSLFAYWIFYKSSPDLRKKIFYTLNLPILKIEADFVYSSEFEEKEQLYRDFINQLTNPKVSAFNFFIRVKKIEALATKFQIRVPREATSSELDQISHTLKNSSNTAFSHPPELSNIAPEILKSYLQTIYIKMYFYGNPNLNKTGHAEKEKILTKIAQGEKFESLAYNYSTDLGSKAWFGDLGVRNFSDFPPEVLGQLQTMQPGDIKPIVSRNFLGIYKLYDKDEESKKIRVGVLALSSENFQGWLEEQLNLLKIKYYLALP